MSETKPYNRLYSHGKLTTWITERCCWCGRFMKTKKQGHKKYCSPKCHLLGEREEKYQSFRNKKPSTKQRKRKVSK